MTIYLFDGTMDGLLTAVFDAFSLKEQPEELLTEGDALPLFCERTYQVTTDEEKARRVWTGLEKKLTREAMKLISVSWLSELKELNTPLFRYVCKVFRQGDISRNYADADVLAVTNIARKVLHEQLRMKQFIRFQKAKDGTYLAVVSPDHNVLPIITDHFSDRFNDQPWLIYDAKRHYGFYYDGKTVIHITFEDETAVPFSLENGKLDEAVLSNDDQLLQNLWRTYFKAICIKERMNPRKQLKDMPRRYWKFFQTPQKTVIATDIDHTLSEQEIKELSWLYGEAQLLDAEQLEGYFVGPRREMVTPWSTNAVEITQNMGLQGISRIEEYFPASSKDAEHDEMLQRMYDGLNQDIFTINIKPEPIKYVDKRAGRSRPQS